VSIQDIRTVIEILPTVERKRLSAFLFSLRITIAAIGDADGHVKILDLHAADR
jgi:hypothetical protein